MKIKLLSLLILFLVGKGTLMNAQVINFPDESFLEYILLYTTVDLNKDGDIQTSEAEAYNGEFIINSNISNLSGLEYFKNITRLGIYSSPITTLNLTQNTKLQYFAAKQTKLTKIDVSSNNKLTQVVVDYNSMLTQCTLGSKPELQLLSLMFNELESIDVSLCPKLTNFFISSNNLTTLDVSKSPKLAELNVGANNLSSLDVSNNTRLTYLNIGVNNITSIDLSKNTILNIGMLQWNPLTTLDLSKNTLITQLVVDGTNISTIDISKLSMLQYFYANNTNLTTLDGSKNENLIYINAVECPLMSFINFKNNHNTNVYGFFSNNSPNLRCIQVDSPEYSYTQQQWKKDSTAVYATDCSLYMGTIEANSKKLTVYPNPTKGILYLNEKVNSVSVYDKSGKLVGIFQNTASIDLGHLPVGNYVVKAYNGKDVPYTITKVIRN